MENTTKTFCSCGEPSCGDRAHVMAKRKTADGIIIKLWSDGAITAGLNTYVIRGARSARAVRLAVAAGWLVVGEVCLYDYAEVRKLCVSARRAVEQTSLEP